MGRTTREPTRLPAGGGSEEPLEQTTQSERETKPSEETTRSEETARASGETTTGPGDTAREPDGATSVGLPAVPLDGEPPLGGASSLDDGDTAAALRGHADGVAATVDRLAATLAEGDADPSELAAARTEASELLALLREIRVDGDARL